MYQNKLLCYKVCYCLGVADETLQCDFPELHEIAKSTGYFDNLKVTREFRAIARIYYTVARHSELYTPEKPFTAAAGTRFKPYTDGTSIAPEIIYQDSDGVQDFICKLAEMAHQRIPALYQELKPALDYLSFETLMWLVPLSADDMQRVHYTLRRIPVQYNIYFFNSPMLNVSLRDMLKTDTALRKCVSLATGRTLDKSIDTSDLAKELDKRDDGYFVSATNLTQNYKNIYMIQKDVPADLQAQILALLAEHSFPVSAATDLEAFKKVWNEREALHEGTVVLLRPTEEELTALRESCPGVECALLIPVARTLYRKILSGEYEGVTLLSLR